MVHENNDISIAEQLLGVEEQDKFEMSTAYAFRRKMQSHCKNCSEYGFFHGQRTPQLADTLEQRIRDIECCVAQGIYSSEEGQMRIAFEKDFLVRCPSEFVRALTDDDDVASEEKTLDALKLLGLSDGSFIHSLSINQIARTNTRSASASSPRAWRNKYPFMTYK